MKMIFESEDCILGILVGLAIIGMSGKLFNLPYAKTILMVLIPIYLIVIVLDVVHEFSELSRHFMFVGSALLHNTFDIILCVAFYALFFSFNIPLISSLTGYLSEVTILYYLGIFEVASHVVWLALSPFNQ